MGNPNGGKTRSEDARVRKAAKSGSVPEVVFLGVVMSDYIYRKGMTVTRGAFERLRGLGELIITDEQLDELFNPGPLNTLYFDLCREKGFMPARLREGDALNLRQILALSKAADILDRRPLAKKLSDVGIGWWEWQTWLSNPIFLKEHRRTAENALEKNQADVLNAMTASAVAGDLRAIEYFNKVSGRYDPNTQNVINVREVLSGVIEILQETLADQPAVLAQIGQKLQLQLLQSGINPVESSVREIEETA